MEIVESGSIFNSITKAAKDAETNNSPLDFSCSRGLGFLRFSHFKAGVNIKLLAFEKTLTHEQEFSRSEHQLKFYVSNNWKFELSILGSDWPGIDEIETI